MSYFDRMKVDMKADPSHEDEKESERAINENGNIKLRKVYNYFKDENWRLKDCNKELKNSLEIERKKITELTSKNTEIKLKLEHYKLILEDLNNIFQEFNTKVTESKK